MFKQLTEINVFISCPSDLDAERHIVESAIAELNAILKDSHRVLLKAVTWEKDVVAGAGNDAQSVINSQIEYEIYLGLLGSRFGTKTPRAGSGTEEEFDRAYKRYKDAPATVRVLFYFKTTLDNVQHLDLAQFQKVKDFRKKLEDSGVFYLDFADQDALLKRVSRF